MRALLILPLLAACAASPDPALVDTQSQTISRNGRDYTVWWTTSEFEIVRHGWASPGEHQQIRADMLALVPIVTGCPILASAILGDSGEMHGPLGC